MKRLLAAGAAVLFCAPAFADITFTPRVSYYFDNILQRSSGINLEAGPEAQAEVDEANALLQDLFGPDAGIAFDDFDVGFTAEQISVPMYGGSFSIGNDRHSLTVTGLYGERTGSISSILTSTITTTASGFVAEDLITATSSGRSESERLDIEATYQRRLNESFALIAGVRYERIENAELVNTVASTTANGANLVNLLLGGLDLDLSVESLTSERTTSYTTELMSARIGASAYAPINQNFGAFMIGMFHVSRLPATTVEGVDSLSGPFRSENFSRDETSLGPDVALGLQYYLSERLSLDLRYRATVYYPVSSGYSSSDSRINHGASLGFAIRL